MKYDQIYGLWVMSNEYYKNALFWNLAFSNFAERSVALVSFFPLEFMCCKTSLCYNQTLRFGRDKLLHRRKIKKKLL
jgi:hypothetical protein